MADGIYSLEEVGKHTSKEDLWIFVWNHVYNVTDYQEDHPGGKEFLLENAGADATTAYEDVGHSTDAREILENFRIGKVTDDDWVDHETKRMPEIKPKNVHVVNNLSQPKSHDLHLPVVAGGLGTFIMAIVLGRRYSSVLHRFQTGGFWKGFALSAVAGKLFWTNMGNSPSVNNGRIMSSNLDGSILKTIIPEGKVHTPKQIKIDHENNKLYFCDREGLRIHRCDFDGRNHEIILQTGDFSTADVEDQTKWCVGIAVDAQGGTLYWSQKGPSKGGQGRIFRANLQIAEGETASSRSDVELLFDKLPEPIDLEFEEDSQTLYWTDRGEYPLGNTLNSAYVGPGDEEAGQVKMLARHFHEAIGLKIDTVNRHIYTTDLGGTVYRFKMDGSEKKKIYETNGAYSGIALAHLH